jgi:Cu/Ag efflux protein CusF
MKLSVTKRIMPAILTLGLAGGVVGTSAGSAVAATKSVSHSATGVISTVNSKADKIALKVGKKSDTFKTTTKTAVTIAGKKSALASLKDGETVTVDYTVSGKTWIASAISAKKA